MQIPYNATGARHTLLKILQSGSEIKFWFICEVNAVIGVPRTPLSGTRTCRIGSVKINLCSWCFIGKLQFWGGYIDS